jgi:hypothetical protein
MALPALPWGIADRAPRAAVLAHATVGVDVVAVAPAMGPDGVEREPDGVDDPFDGVDGAGGDRDGATIFMHVQLGAPALQIPVNCGQ